MKNAMFEIFKNAYLIKFLDKKKNLKSFFFKNETFGLKKKKKNEMKRRKTNK